MNLSVREIQSQDIEHIINYWMNADADYLRNMGADINLLPTREKWRSMLSDQINLSYADKKAYAIIWEIDGKPAGHCNVNKILFGEEAFMHLHFWNVDSRKKGYGTELVKMTIPYFFKNLQLKKLYCEPYAENIAPNRTLEKVGFTFLKEYTTIPGAINFEQPVKLWQLNKKVL